METQVAVDTNETVDTQGKNVVEVRGELRKRPTLRRRVARTRVRVKTRIPGPQERYKVSEFDVRMYGDAAREICRLRRGDVVDISGHLESREVPMEAEGKPIRGKGGKKLTYTKPLIVASTIDPVQPVKDAATDERPGGIVAAETAVTETAAETTAPAGDAGDGEASPAEAELVPAAPDA